MEAWPASATGMLGYPMVNVRDNETGKVPVASLDDSSKTRLADLAAVCANCHRIIHKNGLMPVERLGVPTPTARRCRGLVACG